MKTISVLGLSAFVLALGTVPAGAQPVISAKSGTIAYILGQVYLDEKPVEIQQGAQFPEMKEKSVLRTSDEGRAEVLLPPGVVLRMGESSSFRMISNRLIDTRLEMLAGSAIVEADEIAKDTNVTVVCKNATVTFAKAGIYRFDVDPGRIKVFKGTASVQVGGQTLAVSEGKMLNFGGDTASAEKFDVNSTDSLDNWSRKRGEQMAMANVSAAKRAHTAPWVAAGNPCMSYYGATPYTQSGGWGWNPWYGMITYIPCNGPFMSPYGYRYWSPNTVSRVFYQPPPPTYNGGGGYGGFTPSYPTAGATSSGYSGTVSSAGMSSGSSSAPASSGSTAASAGSAGGASHGAASGGGHGH